MNHAEAIALLDEWYATPDAHPPGYWDELEAAIEGTRCMQVTKQVHIVIELNEAETAMLCYCVRVICREMEALRPDVQRFRTDLLRALPAPGGKAQGRGWAKGLRG